MFFGKYERKLQNCLVAVTLLNQQGKDFLSLAGEYRVASHRECWQSAHLCDPVICTGRLGSLTRSHAATSEARPIMSDNNPCNPRIIDLGYDACEALLVCTISLYSHTQTLTNKAGSPMCHSPPVGRSGSACGRRSRARRRSKTSSCRCNQRFRLGGLCFPFATPDSTAPGRPKAPKCGLGST